MSKKKQVRDLVGFLQGLAIIVFYALSFVVSIIALLVLLVTVCTTNPSSSHSPCTVSMKSDMSELKNNAVVMFVVIMLMFQSVAFRCATSKYFPPAHQQLKKHRIKRLLGKTLVLLNIKLRLYEIVHMLLILSGDVELNPGPITPPKLKKPEDSTDTSSETEQNSFSGNYVPEVATEEEKALSGRDFTMSNEVCKKNGVETQLFLGVGSPNNSAVVYPDVADTNKEPVAHAFNKGPFVSSSAAIPKRPEGFNLDIIGTFTASDGSDYEYHNVTKVPGNLSVRKTKPHQTPYMTSNGTSCPMRKSASSPSYYYDDVTHPDYPKQYRKTRSSSLQQSRARLLSHPLTDDNIAGKALNDQVDSRKPIRAGSKKQMQATPTPGFDEKMNDFIKHLKAKGEWSEDGGFKSNQPLKQFYHIANMLYRSGGTCDVCLLCCKRKKGTPPKSHIFPKCLLEVYRKIHGACDPLCVFDPSTPEKGMFSIKNLAVPLFCSKCESGASADERQLRDLYVFIMSPEYDEKQIKVKEPVWLFRILVTLMFRGMLLMNFFDLLQYDFTKFIQILIEIRQYILSETVKDKRCSKIGKVPQCISNCFGLFLLPNGRFSPAGSELTSLFDFQIRNPQQTSLVQEFGRDFLYTHFDCFHCVLLIESEGTPQQITLHKNCFESLNIHPMRSTESDTPDYEYILLEPSAGRKNIFPYYLLKLNLFRTLALEMIGLKNPEMDYRCRIVTERFPRRHSLPSLKWQSEESSRDEDPHEFKRIEDSKIEDMCKEASKNSSLSGSKLMKSLTKEKKSLQEQLKEKQQDMKTQAKENRQQLYAELAEQSKKYNKLERKTHELEKQVLELKSKLKECTCSLESNTPELELEEPDTQIQQATEQTDLV